MWDTSLTCWTPPPVWAVPPHMSYTPYSLVGFPVHLYVLGICACDMGNIPLMLVVGVGVPPYGGGLGGSASLGVHMLHLVPSCSSLCFTFLPQL